LARLEETRHGAVTTYKKMENSWKTDEVRVKEEGKKLIEKGKKNE